MREWYTVTPLNNELIFGGAIKMSANRKCSLIESVRNRFVRARDIDYVRAFWSVSANWSVYCTACADEKELFAIIFPSYTGGTESQTSA